MIITPTAEHLADPTVMRAELGVDTRAQSNWYAVYTCANHERRVAEQLTKREIEHFLPQYDCARRWKDRTVRLRLPLFPGYVFVHLALQNRVRVLQVPGVVRLVGFDGHAVAVPDEEVMRIRELLNKGLRVEPHKYLKVGRRVRVTAGPLAGAEGIFMQTKSKCRIVLSMDLIMRSVAVEVDVANIEPVC